MIQKIEVKKDLGPNAPAVGAIVKVEFKDGVPVDRFWRRRLKDAEKDGCIKVIKSTAKVK